MMDEKGLDDGGENGNDNSIEEVGSGSGERGNGSGNHAVNRRRPGRPQRYFFDRPDSELSETELRLKNSIIKRRERQNRSYRQRRATQGLATHIQSESIQQNPFAAMSLSNSSPNPTVSSTQTLPETPDVLKMDTTRWTTTPGQEFPSVLEGFDQLNSPSAVIIQNERNDFTTDTELRNNDEAAQVVANNAENALSADFLLEDFESQDLLKAVPFPEHIDLNYLGSACVNEVPVNDELSDQSASGGTHRDEPNGNLDTKENMIELLDTMSDELEIMIQSVKNAVSCLPESSRKALICVGVFPKCFNVAGATAVCGASNSNECLALLDPLFQNNLLFTCKSLTLETRLEVTANVKIYLSMDKSLDEDPKVLALRSNAEERFVEYFVTLLESLNNINIHKFGWVREHAMQTFDTERHSYEKILQLIGKKDWTILLRFMTAAPGVLRFCVSARLRTKYCNMALHRIESASVSLNEHQQFKYARLELCLAEAYLDMLLLRKADGPLSRAAIVYEPVLVDIESGKVVEDSILVADAVLSLLLKANLLLIQQEIDDAYMLLVRALKILTSAQLQKTTLAVNTLTNLISINVSRGQLQRAKELSAKVLEVLKMMKYQTMPIYADVLGLCAVIELQLADPERAEINFRAALNILSNWGDKKWFDIPWQHCLDLDLWLMKGLAMSLTNQGRMMEAEKVLKTAGAKCASRGLGDDFEHGISLGGESFERWLTHTRHIY
uniref:Uncharacterized protein n=1 Tax=Timspurckia oligopyrenoides TaxID=708627 RepID=A0A7S0ZF07_9RHOD|mmetsp:Transcript_2702/g.4756  ORF Transcript_2702/g.4756 Transcript_2702/m.4756 type:complete len:728 (+) Transcript_2702:57-2240(+)